METRDVVCHLSELCEASRNWELSALAVVTGIGFLLVFEGLKPTGGETFVVQEKQ
jgi:hypothetical protein